MQIIVRGHQLQITPAIRQYAIKKMSKMERFFNNIQEVLVELEVQQIKNRDKRQSVHVTIKLSQGVLRGNESDIDIYAAIDKVFLKMEKQVKKHHEKLKGKRKSQQGRFAFKKEMLAGTAKKSFSSGIISCFEKAAAPDKPMDVEEAVLEFGLGSKKKDYFIFKNPRNGSINVLYKIDKENFGMCYTRPVYGTQKRNWLKTLLQKMFAKKEDPTCGVKAIREAVELGTVYRYSLEEAVALAQENNKGCFVFKNSDTKRINALCAVDAKSFGLVETNY